MKYLNNYLDFSEIFESGMSRVKTEKIESYIKELITIEYSPNIINKSKPDEDKRRFNVIVRGNDSKWGEIIEVNLSLDYGVAYDEINQEFKQGTFPYEVGSIISDLTNREVSLYGFDFFGIKVMGKKDGRTREVEDVQNRFNEVMEELDSTPDIISYNYSPIILWFLLK